ncbi:phosphotransferase [Microlunatus flavus]|uniref:Ser/Thr protein kinase RdoA involved in Cpx stress response, MazF antagonist n=1 Tax=Microlunatus flavus TaxID=1036181 RepID=A0A1H9FQP1_9ACTN|nr:phosphotransferase [Microlunatus flavus]SEQ40207.1 Ser/Thr protein kinase RdoA involved in Cpx stress response, MazF antagonist [Microlunatus flavus]
MAYEELPGESEPEDELPHGDVTEGVVRVGATVRRPVRAQSGAVADYLQHLEAVGFRGAPRFLGRDRAGRDVLDFVPGAVAGDPPPAWAADDELLRSVGRLLRDLHDASEGYAADRGFAAPTGTQWFRWPSPSEAGPAAVPVGPPPELVGHNDVTPQNVVVREGRAVALIDFDLAGPTTRLEDLVNTATHWVPLRAPADVWPGWSRTRQPERLRVLADAYGLGAAERASLVDVAVARADRMWWAMRGAAEHLGGGWARMWDHGVGDLIRRRQRWLLDHRDDLRAALA